jgi:hypothetical protein
MALNHTGFEIEYRLSSSVELVIETSLIVDACKLIILGLEKHYRYIRHGKSP